MGEEVGTGSDHLIAGTIIAFLAVAVLAWWGWRAHVPAAGGGGHVSAATPALRLGLADSPLLAVAYQAHADAGPGAWKVLRSKTPSDIGYALLGGNVDAGFVEAAKAKALLATRDASALRILGAITFPYGATVVGRKGAVVRLEQLAGKRLAATSPTSELLGQFFADAKGRGLDPASITVVTTPFDAMVPALEAGSVDAAVLRGAHSLFAVRAGHQIVYQNWQMQPGDECCPPVIAQTEYLLLARGSHPGLQALVASLTQANEAKPAVLRQAAVRATGFPEALLAGFPIASFIVPDAKALAAYGLHDHRDH